MKKVIAIDIGGTKTHGAIIDETGAMLCDIKIATNPKLGKDILIQSLFTIVDKLKSSEDIEAIGVGCAGRINMNNGEVYFGTDNIPDWTGVNLKLLLMNRFNLPVFIDNDVNVAGPGEEWLGVAKGYDSYVTIALGTGIGASIKVNGSLLRGEHWSAGELGHMILHPHGRPCNCGLHGCLEQYCSGPALVKRYNCLNKTHQVNDGYELFQQIKKENPIAEQVLQEFIDDLSIALCSIVNMYDPEIIVIGGGLIDTKEYWWNELMEKINESKLANIFSPKIVSAKLGNLAGLYGAAYLTFEYIETLSK